MEHLQANKMIFGKKGKFALEIENSKKKDKHLLRLWMNGNSYGKFKRSGKLFRLKNELLRLRNLEDELFEKRLENIDAQGFFEFRICTEFPELFSQNYDVFNPPKKVLFARKEFERRKKYIFFPGDFLTDNLSVSVLIKEKSINFYFSESTKKNYKHSKEIISLSYFEVVADEFLKWYEGEVKNLQ